MFSSLPPILENICLFKIYYRRSLWLKITLLILEYSVLRSLFVELNQVRLSFLFLCLSLLNIKLGQMSFFALAQILLETVHVSLSLPLYFTNQRTNLGPTLHHLADARFGLKKSNKSSMFLSLRRVGSG